MTTVVRTRLWLIAMLMVVGCSAIQTAPEINAQLLNYNPHQGSIVVIHKDAQAIVEAKNLGIGRASIELKQGHWPTKVTIRVYVSRLEGFSMRNEQLKLRKSQLTITHHQTKDTEYFEIPLPQSILRDTRKVKFQWVNAYRL